MVKLPPNPRICVWKYISEMSMFGLFPLSWYVHHIIECKLKALMNRQIRVGLLHYLVVTLHSLFILNYEFDLSDFSILQTKNNSTYSGKTNKKKNNWRNYKPTTVGLVKVYRSVRMHIIIIQSVDCRLWLLSHFLD